MSSDCSDIQLCSASQQGKLACAEIYVATARLLPLPKLICAYAALQSELRSSFNAGIPIGLQSVMSS